MKISIITVALNSEKFIEKCLQSVASQDYADIEHIIIDGKSTDNTLDIVAGYNCIVKSEKDDSMYEAINKGLRLSTGDLILILNSDDELCDNGVVSRVVKFAQRYPETMGYYGDRLDIDSDGVVIRRRKSFQVSYSTLLYSRNLTFVSHPTLFLKKQVLHSIGYYDLNYRYASDLDYVLRVLDKHSLKYINTSISKFRIHDDSITASGRIKSEKDEIIQAYYPRALKSIDSILFALVWGVYIFKNLQWYLQRTLKS